MSAEADMSQSAVSRMRSMLGMIGEEQEDAGEGTRKPEFNRAVAWR
jgi:hypothetical protein